MINGLIKSEDDTFILNFNHKMDNSVVYLNEQHLVFSDKEMTIANVDLHTNDPNNLSILMNEDSKIFL